MRLFFWVFSVLVFIILCTLVSNTLTIRGSKMASASECSDQNILEVFSSKFNTSKNYLDGARALKRRETNVNLRGIHGMYAEMQVRYMASFRRSLLIHTLCESQTAKVIVNDFSTPLEVGFPALFSALKASGRSDNDAADLAFCAVMTSRIIDKNGVEVTSYNKYTTEFCP